MIRANEVRLGNWVYDTEGKPNQINMAALRYLNSYGNTPICQVHPIHLSEGVLLKCGFELMPWGFVFKGNDFALLLAWNHKDKFWVEIGNGTKIYFSYLHQLQNMLQLCGQELTYTP